MSESITLETVEGVWRNNWNDASQDPQFIQGVVNLVNRLAPDDRRKFMRGKKALILRALHGGARSSAYEMQRAANLYVALAEMNLLDLNTWRDVQTGRKCKTLVRELARLGLDWKAPETREIIKANWAQWAALPVMHAKILVRENLGRNADRRAIYADRFNALFQDIVREMDETEARELLNDCVRVIVKWLDK